jgi:hypothetical protein
MIKVVAIILSIVLAVGFLATVGIIGYKTIGYMVNQKFAFGDAVDWAWKDYTEMIGGIFEKAEADGYFEYPITTNRYVNVVGCTSL